VSLPTGQIKKGVVLAGRYRVIRKLGSGGMATVFLAEDERLGRRVAVKRLHTDAPEASLERFEREARLGAALNHPNIVAIYDTVVAEEGALIVMEYFEGTSLSELAHGRRMRPERALPILRGVAHALDHAHAEGVVHRDVKPGNVIVGDDGRVKLTDLGIARAVGASQITSEGSVVGTVPYMSPERLAGPGAGGPESDVYALAAVAYELLSGQPPSDASSREEASVAPTRDLRRGWPQGSSAVLAVLERGMEQDPERRPPSAGSLVEELSIAIERGESETVRAPFDPGVPTERMSRTGSADALGWRRIGGRSSYTRPLAIGSLLLGILAVGAIAFTGGDGEDTTRESGSGDVAREPAQTTEPAPAQEPAPADEAAPAEEQPPAQESASEATSAAALNDQGFALIQGGRYGDAIPILERAVAGAERGGGLTYAYALFNLGNALRLAGRPEEAIPILEARLEIPNQRGTVTRELEAARAAAGGGDGEGGD
jgi:tetratricopeptide (TPR) repeat protein/predicted Ser/Thr protein kinase